MYRKVYTLKFADTSILDLNLDLIQLHSLQVGDDSRQLSPWHDHPRLTNWDGKLSDFRTVHVVQQLDLVICVDTAVAIFQGHLIVNMAITSAMLISIASRPN